MERKAKALSNLTLVLALVSLFSAQVGASGGFGCPGVDHFRYKCDCGNGQREEYFNNEDLKAAYNNPHSCCYSKPVPIAKATVWIAPSDDVINNDWVNFTKKDYKTDCWGVCPADVIRINSAWLYNKAVGAYKLESGVWLREASN